MCKQVSKYMLGYTSKDDGTSAVEFALVAPILFALIFGIICYGTLLGTYHGVQELASEAARASVGGLTDQERSQLAQTFVQANAGSYAFIDPTKLTIAAQSTGNPATAYQVTVNYNMSNSFVYQLAKFAPMPAPLVSRSAVVQFGGY
ncbi:TadE-like protein [Rhizobiales bacterium GAS113]|jgi:Flp pilus assembly protein TadG|nr:TadE-like protein [Rhizobiales bacterium GAS113]SED46560.1 TadE-like protein [Rhizobiales bacterium GAS188]